MNKLFACSILLVLIFGGCATTVRPPEDSNDVTLDQAIKEAAARIDGRLEAGTKIAILNFNSPSIRFSEYVISELEANLLDTGKLIIVDRHEVDLIRSEFNFQFSGEVGDDSMQELGRMLGAQSIVSGSLTEIGGSYRIVIRVLTVQTAVVAVQYRTDFANDSRVQALLTSDNFGRNTTTAGATTPQIQQLSDTAIQQTPSVSPVATSVRSVPAQIYEIGDIGPAGGTVFYDKGQYTDGWRYIEYAPENFRSVYWGPYGLNIPGTETGIGTGKSNTDIIVQALTRRGEKDMAAQLCSQYIYNGYNDWFLPSKDELNLLYTFLNENKMFDSRFGFDGWYYSSSQYDDSNAWGQIFQLSHTYQGEYRKNISGGYVRAVRVF
jgi:TolB-like protein